MIRKAYCLVCGSTIDSIYIDACPLETGCIAFPCEHKMSEESYKLYMDYVGKVLRHALNEGKKIKVNIRIRETEDGGDTTQVS